MLALWACRFDPLQVHVGGGEGDDSCSSLLTGLARLSELTLLTLAYLPPDSKDSWPPGTFHNPKQVKKPKFVKTHEIKKKVRGPDPTLLLPL